MVEGVGLGEPGSRCGLGSLVGVVLMDGTEEVGEEEAGGTEEQVMAVIEARASII